MPTRSAACIAFVLVLLEHFRACTDKHIDDFDVTDEHDCMGNSALAGKRELRLTNVNCGEWLLCTYRETWPDTMIRCPSARVIPLTSFQLHATSFQRPTKMHSIHTDVTNTLCLVVISLLL